eukprot:scaffold90135_cov69-Phaeocystis_antarctica.AAC.3
MLLSSPLVTLPEPPPHLTSTAAARNPLVNPPGPPAASLPPPGLMLPAPASCTASAALCALRRTSNSPIHTLQLPTR